jgi:hypothetical protein
MRSAAVLSAMLGVGMMLAGHSVLAAISYGDSSKTENDANMAAITSCKITYTAKRKSLAVILNDLSKISGIDLRAGDNRYDWRVRDRKMSIFVKDMPLSNLMNSISRVTKLTWRENDKHNPPIYNLYMKAKTLQEAIDSAHREEELLEEKRSQKREAAVDDLSKLGGLSDEEMAKLRATDPWGYVLASTGVAKSLGYFLGQAPCVRDAFAGGQQLTMSPLSLSLEAQQALLNAMQSMWRLSSVTGGGSKYPGIEGKIPLPEDISSKLAQMTITINSNLGLGDMAADPMLGNLSIGYPINLTDIDGNIYAGSDSVGLQLMDSSSSVAKAIGSAVAGALDGNAVTSDIYSNGLQAELSPSELRVPDFGEAIVEHPDDPALSVNVSLKAKNDEEPPKTFEDFLAAIGESTSFSIVSDNFVNRTTLTVPENMELSKLLKGISVAYRYNWWRSNNLIELIDRFWIKKLLLQIPNAWLEEWRQNFKDNGTLFIDDLAQIADLTEQQFDANIKEDQILGQFSLSNAYAVYKEPLRFYAKLDVSQREGLFSEKGLDIRQLTEYQQRTAEKIITQAKPLFFNEHGIDLSFIGTWEPYGNQISYSISVVNTYDQSPTGIYWRIVTPAYAEPEKESEKKRH